MLELYDFLDSGNGYKIRLLLNQLNRPFKLHCIDLMKGESRTAEFLAMNPKGKIPVLRLDDGSFLSESNAIIFFLAQGTRFLPDDSRIQIDILQWLFFEQNFHEPNIASRRFQIRHVKPADQSKQVMAEKLRLGNEALSVMEAHLQKHNFLVDAAYSIADIGLFAYTHLADEGGYTLADFSAVGQWRDRVKAQPGFKGFYADW
jgi:glutathione S-transferase